MTNDNEAFRIMLSAADLVNDADLDRPMSELLEENEHLDFYAFLLMNSRRGLRQKTLQRLLYLVVQLLYDQSRRGGIFEKWMKRKEDHVKITASNYFSSVTVEDVEEVLGVSRRTAMDYKKVVNWIGVWLL